MKWILLWRRPHHLIGKLVILIEYFGVSVPLPHSIHQRLRHHHVVIAARAHLFPESGPFTQLIHMSVECSYHRLATYCFAILGSMLMLFYLFHACLSLLNCHFLDAASMSSKLMLNQLICSDFFLDEAILVVNKLADPLELLIRRRLVTLFTFLLPHFG